MYPFGATYVIYGEFGSVNPFNRGFPTHSQNMLKNVCVFTVPHGERSAYPGTHRAFQF